MPTTALIIIHPRELLRLGLQSVLKGQAGFKVLGQESTGKEAQKLVKQHEPNLILLYDQLDDQDSFDLAKQLKESNPDLKIVMLGCRTTPPTWHELLPLESTIIYLKDPLGRRYWTRSGMLPATSHHRLLVATAKSWLR